MVAGLLVNGAAWLVESADWEVTNTNDYAFDCPGCNSEPFNDTATIIICILCDEPPDVHHTEVYDTGVRATACDVSSVSFRYV